MNLLEAEFGEPRHKWATQAGAIRVLDRELPSTCLGRLLHCLDMAATAMLCRPLDLYVIAMKLDRTTSGPYFKAYEYWLAQTEPDQRNAASLAWRLDITHADLASQEMRAQSALSALKMIQPSAGEAYERLFKASPITIGISKSGRAGGSTSAPSPATSHSSKPITSHSGYKDGSRDPAAPCYKHGHGNHTNAQCFTQRTAAPASSFASAAPASSYHTANSGARSGAVTTSHRDYARSLQTRAELATGQAALHQHLSQPPPQRRLGWSDQPPSQRPQDGQQHLSQPPPQRPNTSRALRRRLGEVRMTSQLH